MIPPPRNWTIPLILAALLAGACIEISRLRSALSARPAVQDKTVIRTVEGPTRTEIRTIIKPGGERVEEKIVYVESKTTNKESDHSEKPEAVRFKTRYVGVGISPLDYGRPTLRAGLTVFDSFDVGGTFDTRSMRPGVEVAFRF